MQINHISNQNLSVESVARRPSLRASLSPTDQAVFAATEALNRALAEAPDIRTPEVAHGADLVTTVQYPPMEMIKRISRLLANNWDGPPK